MTYVKLPKFVSQASQKTYLFQPAIWQPVDEIAWKYSNNHTKCQHSAVRLHTNNGFHWIARFRIIIIRGDAWKNWHWSVIRW